MATLVPDTWMEMRTKAVERGSVSQELKEEQNLLDFKGWLLAALSGTAQVES